LNADCLRIALSDKGYADILKKTSLVLPDGIGLKLATALFGGKMVANCNGTDLSPALMTKATAEDLKIFFLGGREGVAAAAAENAAKKISGIRITGTENGFFKDDASVIEKINRSGADILFVAMGVPIQEKWIDRNRGCLNPKLCLGVGALFDYMSGRVIRAPKFMRALRLEWLWRVLIEPRRMFKRYLVDGIGFFLYLFYSRIKLAFIRN
jgi:exopolysaccharide biosynthesis WecB/TagA/CpsF family protein